MQKRIAWVALTTFPVKVGALRPVIAIVYTGIFSQRGQHRLMQQSRRVRIQPRSFS
jgi:hypothetical protein